MKRSIYAGLVILTLATVTAVAVAPRTAADAPAVETQKLRADGNTRTIAAAPSTETVPLLCPPEPVAGLETALLPTPILRPQAGEPCCATLCDQICGVGEPCLCKRCQVLGCGL